YTRTVGPFMKVEGWGKSLGHRESKDDSRSSSLHFGTPQKLSPIREGRGYWKYIPKDHDTKTTFLTEYNYDVNFGKMGSLFDIAFRPLIGWGTALSFDVLKRWLEKGEAPKLQFLRFFFTYGISYLFVFIWLYNGLIPKLLAKHPDEIHMTSQAFQVTGS